MRLSIVAVTAAIALVVTACGATPAASPAPASTSNPAPPPPPVGAAGASPVAPAQAAASAAPSAQAAPSVVAASPVPSVVAPSPVPAAAAQSAVSSAATGAPIKVRLLINPQILGYLPFFVALEKGYLADAGLDVEITRYQGPLAPQMPRLARGEVDITPMVAIPAFFNLFSQGFSVKLLAASVEERAGYPSSTVMLARKDLYDDGSIRQAADLKGKKVDAAGEGSATDFLTRQALKSAGLAMSDATVTYQGRTPADTQTLFVNKGIDAGATIEPAASQMVAAGVAVKLFGTEAVAPGYQNAFIGASDDFLNAQPQAVVRFLRGYLKAAQFIDAANKQWTPELLQIASKWTDQTPEIIQAGGPPAYFPPDADINVQELALVEQTWVDAGLVPVQVPVDTIVDTGPLKAAKAP